MTTLIKRVITGLEERRERLFNNQLNCIPSPFKRFSEDFIGIEQACHYVVTASTKGAKSQFTSYTFIYKPLMFCYYTKADIDYKVIYFPLEETPERILQRFICWLLFDFTKGEIRISPKDLRSTTSPVDEKILDIINSDEIQDILKYFEEHVIFPTEKPNPTGMYFYCKKYAEEHGKVTTKAGKYTDEFGVIKDYEAFDTYVPDNPNEYRVIITDTTNLIDTERGMTLKQSMDKWSEYCAKYLRNRYKYTIVEIQQQAFEGENNDSFKLGRLKPSIANLGDSKYSARNADIVLGIYSPFKFGLSEYLGYDITKFKDNIRFLEVCINRNGQMGGICPLFFDGAVCYFSELPLPNNKIELNKIYKYLDKIRNNIVEKSNVSMHIYASKHNDAYSNKINNKQKFVKKLHYKNILSKFATLFNLNNK